MIYVIMSIASLTKEVFTSNIFLGSLCVAHFSLIILNGLLILQNILS